jgi:cystathionine gamma-synthase
MRKPETRVAQGGDHEDVAFGAFGGVVPTIVPSTTYLRGADYEPVSGRIYTRDENPTGVGTERLLANLEGGHAAMLFASGMAAATALFRSLPPSAHVVAPKTMYFALNGWLRRSALDVTFCDMADAAALASSVRPETRLVWVETPANPTVDVTDLRAAATAAHAHGALLVVDSTVATPVHTRPIEHGADLVMHSATKSLNGHCDVLAGVLVAKEPSELWTRIAALRHDEGPVLGPFESWLLARGLRTLYVRVERASQSALHIARHFEKHPKVRAVLYPGLPEHRGHAVAKRQMERGFGSVVSLCFGDRQRALAVLARLEVFLRATSLGGTESLAEHRATVEGPLTTAPEDLVRFSIGLEDPGDLVADLEAALAALP